MFRQLCNLVAEAQTVSPPPFGRWQLTPVGGGFYALKIADADGLHDPAAPIVARPRRMAYLLADLIDN